MKHANIAIFVPNAGCPHQCAFCDQRYISGKMESPAQEKARNILEQAVRSLPASVKPAQIAFFGGSFTAIPREYMLSLLKTARGFIDGENVNGIRISTRPDAINDEILDILELYGVTDIELGAQSMDDRVLLANIRGHTAEDTVKAANLIKSRGFGLVLQMMTGLYTSTTVTTQNTAMRIARLKPNCVRIYPTIVLRGTKLAQLYENGEYCPQPLDSAVEECAGLLEFFENQGINVIKLGLHDSPDLMGNYVAGPHHPAFRELCESRIMMRGIMSQIEKKAIPKGNITIYTSHGSESKAAGHKRENSVKLESLGYRVKIISDNKHGLEPYGVIVSGGSE